MEDKKTYYKVMTKMVSKRITLDEIKFKTEPFQKEKTEPRLPITELEQLDVFDPNRYNKN